MCAGIMAESAADGTRRPRERSGTGKAAWGLRFAFRSILLSHHGVYLAYSRLKHPSKTVSNQTEVVIEAPLRCGNTFAVAAFRMAQGRPVRIAHHRHAAAQVVAGCAMGLPVLVLTREPEDAAVSQVIFQQGRMSLGRALRDYVRFYEDVLPLRERFLLADFSEVTSDFGRVMLQLNQKFGTSFRLFDHTDENVEKCFARIEEGHARRYGRVLEHAVARPSPGRSTQSAALLDQLRSPELAHLLDSARAVYSSLRRP